MSIDINWDEYDRQRKHDEGTGHIKFGVGIGLAGATSLALIGTTCPLCFFVAPAMVGLGVWKRHTAGASHDDSSSDPSHQSRTLNTS